VTAPAGAEQAAACVAALSAARLPQQLAGGPEPALADCGRLYPGSPALAVAAAAQLTLLVVRPRVSELAHLEPRIRGLQQAGLQLALVLAPAGRLPSGEPSYPADEIAGVLGVPVRAALPADRRAAGELLRRAGSPGQARRLPLLREAAAIAGALDGALGQPPPGPAVPAAQPGHDDTETEAVAGDRG
jgi:hypothetical protein